MTDAGTAVGIVSAGTECIISGHTLDTLTGHRHRGLFIQVQKKEVQETILSNPSIQNCRYNKSFVGLETVNEKIMKVQTSEKQAA